MIEKIEITGLFSTFEYHIDMPDKGSTQILTGPNGYGKTTILCIIEALCSLDLLYFYYVPFKSIKVFYDTHELFIESVKSYDEGIEDQEIELHSGINFTLRDRMDIGNLTPSSSIILSTKWEIISTLFETLHSSRRLPFPEYDSDDISSVNQLRAKDDETHIRIRKNILNRISKTQPSYESFMIMMRNLSVNVKFIPAQRLVSKAAEKSSEILRVSDEIKDYLEECHYDFLRNSQSHDERFISRLMTDKGQLSESEYLMKVKDISSMIIEAMKFDLTGKFFIPEYNDSKSEILKSYMEDLEEKLSSLKSPIKDLNLFSRLIDKKKFVGKHCSFSRRHGLQFIAESDQSVIPLNALSSGEINQIIMLYDFIFNTSDDSILMIDEPEISLHVVWQHAFMKDISEIAREKRLSVLVATHSPQVIGSRWKECFDLYGATKS